MDCDFHALGRIRMHFRLKKLVIVLAVCAFGSCVFAQQSAKSAAREAKQSLFKAQHFDQAAISPDGKHVAWVETRADADGAPTGKQDIFVQDLSAAGKPARVTAGAATSHFNEGNIAWSPDSKRIAFTSDAAKSGQSQLYVTGSSGGPARKLTSVKGFLADPKCAPDGKSIAVLLTENATREAGPLVAETPETGEIKDAFFEQRLAVVDAASGKLRQVTPRAPTFSRTTGRPTARTSSRRPPKGMATANG